MNRVESANDEAIVAVDAMGGDLGPSEVVEAVKLAFQHVGKLSKVILVGDEAVLAPELERAGLARNPSVSIHHASEVITMEDKPLQSLKRKKDSSMFRAIELVKEGQAKALISCGNTGCLMAGGTIKLRTLPGVDRPALATVIPNKKRHFVLIDAGANPEARPEHLVHNAILGSIYCRIALGVDSPRIGLLTIGTEEGKGNELTHQTHELLKKTGSLINYSGPIEGFHVFDNQVDVVVCDGFVGNILLKTCESLFHTLKDYLKEELTATWVRKAGAFLAMGAFKEMKQQLNPDSYGGAPLLGLKGNILKAHGSSNRTAIMNAIRMGSEMVAHHMNDHIIEDVAKANESIQSRETVT
jgi:phosphate acyltransferase